MNGDGFDDILLGATHFSKQRGAAYLLFGGSGTAQYANIDLTTTLAATVGVLLTGQAINDQAGCVFNFHSEIANGFVTL